MQTGAVWKRDLGHVTVDTTGQENAVHFPPDVRLCHEAREALVRLAGQAGVALRQSYVRKSKQALFMANRYMAARQTKRARKKIKEVRNYVGVVKRKGYAAVGHGRVWYPEVGVALGKARIVQHQT